MSIFDLMEFVGFCLTLLSIGYSLGKDINKKQK